MPARLPRKPEELLEHDRLGVPTVDMDLGSWFAGTPGQLVDRLKGFEERYPGMQHISLSNPIGTPEAVMLEQFQWLAEEVMPAFKAPRR